MLEAGTTCWRVETAPRAALLVDMQPYLAAARAAMSRATRSIYFLNWAFDPDTVLDHTPTRVWRPTGRWFLRPPRHERFRQSRGGRPLHRQSATDSIKVSAMIGF